MLFFTTELYFIKNLICPHTSLANVFKYSKLSLEQRLPVQRICWILPGTSSFLNLDGIEGER